MNEDEAFIRAVVDSPGDDTPRLVYADWLDDRADPRGPYLRAEHSWTQAGRKRKPPRASAGLDTEWVARVSRPPLGVCCDHLRLSSIGMPAEPAALTAAVGELGVVALPPHLRALLLNYRLGQLRGGPFVLPAAGGRDKLPIDGFVCLDDPDYDDAHISYELIDRTCYEREEYGANDSFVFLAATFDDSIDVVVSCRPRGRGAVYLADGSEIDSHPKAGLTRVAASVGEFLAMLEPRSWPLTND